MSDSENNPQLEALKIVVGETVVGSGRLEDGVLIGELTAEGAKQVFPEYDSSEDLSIRLADTPERAYVLDLWPDSEGFVVTRTEHEEKGVVVVEGPQDSTGVQHWSTDASCRLAYPHSQQVCGHSGCLGNR